VAVDLSAQTPALSTVHHPLGRPGGPGLFRVKDLQLPAYIQNIAAALERSGHLESQAIQLAIGACQRWASGAGKVSPEVRAAAAKALVEWEAAKARAHATHSHANDTKAVELAFNEALHPRVPAGGAGGGEFGSSSSKTAAAKKPAAKKGAAKKPAAKPKAKPAVKKAAAKPVATAADKAKAAQLHTEANADRVKAKALLTQIGALNKQIKTDQVAAAKAAAAAKKTKSSKSKNATAAAKVAAKSKSSAAKKKTATAKKATVKQLTAKRATLRAKATSLMSQAKALDAQAKHLTLANDGDAVELAVKTPAPERAAGRRKLAAEGKALPGGEDPIPDLDYLKRAIQSVGRLDPSKRPALKALIIKRARELKAMDEPGVKGTWPFEAANDTEGIELAMMTRTARVRGPGDVSCSRTAPGEVTVTHKPTGMRIGKLAPAQHGGWQGTHATGKATPPSGSMAGALSGLIGVHNRIAAAAPSAEPVSTVRAMAAHEAAMELAGSLPSTSAATSSDGPRMTTIGGGKPASAPTTFSAATIASWPAEVQKVYRKLIAKGMKPGQALALAKRAAQMHAKATAKAA
jgi:chemotaxis protein histidine kinase CheA